jgi:hypothetical protein
MKNKMNKILLLAGLLVNQQLLAVSETDTWQEEYQFDRGVTPRLVVENVWGDVNVTSHSGNTMKVSVQETRYASNNEVMERSYKLLYLDVLHTSDSLELVVDGITKRDHGWRDCRGCRLELQFDIQVPRSANLEVSTVNDGAVFVSGVRGLVDARNVNGDVTVEDLFQCGTFKTINGEIDVGFAKAPEGDCSFTTINGDITARLPTNAGADLSMDIGNGSISSDFELAPLAMPATIEKSASRHGGTRYRISKSTGLRLGRGGANMEFESLNGDIEINQNH